MDVFGDLDAGDPLPLIEAIEQHLTDRYEDHPDGCADWYESTFRFAMTVWLEENKPDGWVVEEEKKGSGFTSRADIVLTTPEDKTIVFELKYVANKNVHFAGRTQKEWWKHISEGHQRILQANDLSKLKIYTHKGSTTTMYRWVLKSEFVPTKKRPRGKFEATKEELCADEAYVLVGMGTRVHLFQHTSFDEVLAIAQKTKK